MIAYRDLEKIIWSFTLLLMSLGLLTLYSAAYNNVRVSQGVFYDQLVCAFLSCLLMVVLNAYGE